jgi:hypothetical protein
MFGEAIALLIATVARARLLFQFARCSSTNQFRADATVNDFGWMAGIFTKKFQFKF